MRCHRNLLRCQSDAQTSRQRCVFSPSQSQGGLVARGRPGAASLTAHAADGQRPVPQIPMRPLNGSNPSAASTSYARMAETNGNGRSANGNGSSNGTGSRPGPSLGGPASSTRLATLMAEAEAQQRDIPLDTNFRWSQLWLLDKPWAYVGGFTEDRKKQRTRSLASWVRESILELGPTFIKLGQLSSTRSDLFASEFVEELSKLQDRVPAFPAETAVATIEAQLGQPLNRMFKEFEMKPIAAASLGQVHRAQLWTGEEVAVKIQRPGLKKLFDIDLENLRVLAEQLDRGDDDRDFKGIYEECANILYQEIDYIAEGRNCNRFSRNFRDTRWVVAPKVHWQYSAPRVLTLEYLPGTKVTDSAQLQALSLDPQMIARRATEAYLIQILRYGFFHADPHPGNISVDPNGNLLFYDFGMMGEIVPSVREKLLEVFYGVYKKQTDRVVAALVDLEIIKPIGGDVISIQRAIGYGLENLAVQTERKATAAAIGEDLFAIALDQPFRFPATFTFVLRSFATLEGIGRTLDPDFKFVEVARPYAQELLDLQDAQGGQFVLQELQQQATETATAAASVPMRVQRMAGTMERLEAGDLKLRVRVLEAERAARRSGILQIATMNTIVSVGFLNVGTTLATSGHAGPASLVFALSGLFGAFVYAGFKRVGRLDKLEKAIRG